MFARLYAEPIRVYIFLGVLGLVGILAGLGLPVSLFPNSAKPVVWTGASYGSLTASEFIESYGNDYEAALRGISAKTVKVERVESTYSSTSVNYEVAFTWGSDPDDARREVENVVNAWTARFPQDIRDTVWSYLNNENSGFFAASAYSDKRSLDEVYDLLDAAMKAKLNQVPDAQDPELWNPARKEIRIVMKPEAMANLQLVPRDVERAVNMMMAGSRGGSVTVGTNQLTVELPRSIKTPEDLNDVPVSTPSGRVVHLSDIALIDLGLRSTDSNIVKTSGAPSVVLYATPKPGGNVKKMSEDLLAVIAEAKVTLPPDIQFKVLVDPSGFIESATLNVAKEVGIGALLAVGILFIFIGSLKNVVTAAIEIPLSIVMAFILMRLTGVSINLISLGGLALSAGMNVDGSVVVMENIFRHFGEVKGKTLTAKERLAILVEAVAEVRLPLIASTVASLVVFLPLTFTSALSYAILGDLAKAVVFSHGLSAIVALILVPTVRLHLMGRGTKTVDQDHHESLFEPFLGRLDTGYARALGFFIDRPLLKWSIYGGLVAALAALVLVVLPTLPREVIGTPDSDMLYMSVNTSGNTLIKQMEAQSDEVERDLLNEFGDRIAYTFTQINGVNRAWILAKLKDKSTMETTWKAVEKRFSDTAMIRFAVAPWNPSELPIPDPPDLRLAIRGGDINARRDATLELSDLLEGSHIYDRVYTVPSVERQKGITLKANPEQWLALAQAGVMITPQDLADVSRVATQGRRISQMSVSGRETRIILRYPDGYLDKPEDLAAMPIGIAGKIVPLKSLLPLTLAETAPPVFRENGQDLFVVYGRHNKSTKVDKPAALAKAKALVGEWQKKHVDTQASVSRPVVVIEDAGKDVTEAIEQLATAIGISVVLIFLVLLLQFGSLVESLLVLVAVPLGFIGVILALKFSGSTLSLNSALGVILLNGIAVNNSILMVDFIRRLAASGLSPREAATTAARKRLRPILITSLTTVLGMLPIALGFGEGGRILQPLGIAVSGGLWISMALTLFLVPALHVSYLESKAKRLAKAEARASTHESLVPTP